jgi:hypothetical protein
MYKEIGTWQKVNTQIALMELQLWFPNITVWAKLDAGETLESPFAYYRKG